MPRNCHTTRQSPPVDTASACCNQCGSSFLSSTVFTHSFDQDEGLDWDKASDTRLARPRQPRDGLQISASGLSGALVFLSKHEANECSLVWLEAVHGG